MQVALKLCLILAGYGSTKDPITAAGEYKRPGNNGQLSAEILAGVVDAHCEIVGEWFVKLSGLISEALDNNSGSENQGGDD